MSELKNTLVGQTITGYHLEEDGAFLTLYRGGLPPIILDVWGECCSQTWIESIDLPANLIGTIQDVTILAMPDLGNIGTEKHRTVEYVTYYGVKITTDRGSAVIDFRNDSNGYYGGGLEVRK